MPNRYANKYGTLADKLSAEGQLLLLEYDEFHNEVREFSTTSFRIPYTKRERTIAAQRVISETSQAQMRDCILRYHGWACMYTKKSPRNVSFKKLLKSQDIFYRHLKFLRENREYKIRSLTKTCQAVKSYTQFSMNNDDCDEEDKKAYREMLIVATQHQTYFARRAQTGDENVRISLCELRDQNKMLSFTDLVNVCHYQRRRYAAMKKLCGRPGLSQGTAKQLKALLLVETTRLAVLITLLKYPLRTREAEKALVRWTGKSSGRFVVEKATRKRKSYPLDDELSSYHVEIFRCLEECRGDAGGTGWHPFGQPKLVLSVLQAVTKDISGVRMSVQQLRTAAESHVDLLDGQNSRSIQQSLSYAEGHSITTARHHYKNNSSGKMIRGWTRYVDGFFIPAKDVGPSEVSETDLRIENAMKDSQKRWMKETNAKVKTIMGGVRVATPVPWTPAEDEEIREGVEKHGQKWKKILETSPLLQKRVYQSELHARDAIKDRWRKRLEHMAPISEPAKCLWCGAADPKCSPAQKMRGCRVRKCNSCVKKILLRSSRTGRGHARRCRRKKRRTKGKDGSDSSVVLVTGDDEVQSKHYPTETSGTGNRNAAKFSRKTTEESVDTKIVNLNGIEEVQSEHYQQKMSGTVDSSTEDLRLNRKEKVDECILLLDDDNEVQSEHYAERRRKSEINADALQLDLCSAEVQSIHFFSSCTAEEIQRSHFHCDEMYAM